MKYFCKQMAQIIYICGFLTPLHAWAGFDLAVGGYGRDYPMGAGAELNLGYGHLLWGSSSEKLYGFIRAGLDIEGVVDYNAVNAKLEIFPISILGLRVGQSRSESQLDYEDFDCELYLCRGHFAENYFEVPVFLGYGPVTFAASYKHSQWKSDSNNAAIASAQFIEPSSGLALAVDDTEDVERVRGTVFLDLGDRWLGGEWRLGYSEARYSVESSTENVFAAIERDSRIWLGLLQYSMEEPSFQVTLGTGEYRSYLLPSDPTFVVSFSFAPDGFSKLGY
jgi:hypothetical protein